MLKSAAFVPGTVPGKQPDATLTLEIPVAEPSQPSLVLEKPESIIERDSQTISEAPSTLPVTPPVALPVAPPFIPSPQNSLATTSTPPSPTIPSNSSASISCKEENGKMLLLIPEGQVTLSDPKNCKEITRTIQYSAFYCNQCENGPSFCLKGKEKKSDLKNTRTPRTIDIFPFDSAKSCTDSLAKSQSGKICITNGGKIFQHNFFVPYYSSVTPSTTFQTLEQCNEALTQERNSKLKNIKDSLKAKEIDAITLLKSLPDINELFSRSAQVHEGYTVEEHTKVVLNTFKANLEKRINESPFNRLDKNKLLVIIALHDIGKSLGDSKTQHKYTTPILESTLKELGFSEGDIILAKSLIDHDAVGDYYKNKAYNNGALDLKMTELAQKNGMTKEEYSALQFMFFISDSTAYPGVKANLFPPNSGNKIRPFYNPNENLEIVFP